MTRPDDEQILYALLLALFLFACAFAVTSCATVPPSADACEWSCWQRLEGCRGEWPARACGHEQQACEERCRK
jgi:hypothetical protein